MPYSDDRPGVRGAARDPRLSVLAGPEAATYPEVVTTAAALIIGDEILSGKTRDANGPLLIELLRDLGVRLERLVYIGDQVTEIASELRRCAGR